MTAIPAIPEYPQPAPHPRRSAWRFRLIVFGGWALFALLVVSISMSGTPIRGRSPFFHGLLTWNLAWMLWALATFLVVRLARRHRLERENLITHIPTHVLLGAALSAALVFTEFILHNVIAALLTSARVNYDFFGYFVYKFHIYFIIYWAVLGATWAYDFHARYREKELQAADLEGRLARAQLGALQMQLQPHFLFNTHHSIIALMLKNENAAAVNMLTRLSDLLRLTLRRAGQQVTSLKEELEALDLYLGIQKERYRDRLAVRIEVDPALATAEVPTLLLQPLVENAMKHGIDKMSEGGVVEIRAWQEGMRLHVLVADNGPGLPGDFDVTNGNGIGLQNTRARLERLYGTSHRFDIGVGEGGRGTEVRIELPLRAYEPPPPQPQEQGASA
jgi:signal transduction histidine kinase